MLLGALAGGALLLLSSFYYLFRVFKGQTAFAALFGAPGSQHVEQDDERAARVSTPPKK